MKAVEQNLQGILDSDPDGGIRLLCSVLDQLPCSAFLVEVPQREIAWCNAGTEKVFGYAPSDLVGTASEKLHVDTKHHKHFGAWSEPVLERGETFVGRYWMKHRDGSIFPSEHVVTPVATLDGLRLVVSLVYCMDTAKEATPLERRQLARKLSARENEVLDFVLQGLSSKQIARELGLSHRTVETHRSNILHKLEFETFRELLAEIVADKSA